MSRDVARAFADALDAAAGGRRHLQHRLGRGPLRHRGRDRAGPGDGQERASSPRSSARRGSATSATASATPRSRPRRLGFERGRTSARGWPSSPNGSRSRPRDDRVARCAPSSKRGGWWHDAAQAIRARSWSPAAPASSAPISPTGWRPRVTRSSIYDALARAGVERNLDWLSRTPRRQDRAGRSPTSATRPRWRDAARDAQGRVPPGGAGRGDDEHGRSARGFRDQHRRHAEPARGGAHPRAGDAADLRLDQQGLWRPRRYRFRAARTMPMCPTDRSVRAHGIGEARPLDFHTPYGCSKGAADQYVLDYARSFGLPHRGAADELHLRPAPDGHRGPGLGRAFPDPRARRASRSRSTATAGRCATSSTCRTRSRPILRPGATSTRSPAAPSTSAAGPDNAVSLRQLLAHIGDAGRPRRSTSRSADWRAGRPALFRRRHPRGARRRSGSAGKVTGAAASRDSPRWLRRSARLNLPIAQPARRWRHEPARSVAC